MYMLKPCPLCDSPAATEGFDSTHCTNKHCDMFYVKIYLKEWNMYIKRFKDYEEDK